MSMRRMAAWNLVASTMVSVAATCMMSMRMAGGTMSGDYDSE